MKKDIEWLKAWFDDGKSYPGGYVKFKINQIDDVKNLSQELPVIPKYVADWWERDGDSVTLYGGLQVKKKHKFDLVSSFHDKGLGDYLSRVEDWIDENKSTFLDLVNGKTYEIEKEEFYQVIIPTKDAAWKYYYLDSDGGINAGNDLEYVECHTETFIRSVSDDLWQFAVEVAE